MLSYGRLNLILESITMIIGIEIKGKDYGGIGHTDDEFMHMYDERIDYVESFGLLGGGCLLSETNVCFSCSRENGKDVTLASYKKFMRGYYRKFPTFDGMIYLLDLDHLPSGDMKLVDAFVNHAKQL